MPTFPRATHLVPELGQAYFASDEGRARPNYDMFAESKGCSRAASCARATALSGGSDNPSPRGASIIFCQQGNVFGKAANDVNDFLTTPKYHSAPPADDIMGGAPGATALTPIGRNGVILLMGRAERLHTKDPSSRSEPTIPAGIAHA